jgi:hypothetical protein
MQHKACMECILCKQKVGLVPFEAGSHVIIFKNLVRTSKEHNFTITTINWVLLFKEIITDYSENSTEFIIQIQSLESLSATAPSACGYHWASKG